MNKTIAVIDFSGESECRSCADVKALNSNGHRIIPVCGGSRNPEGIRCRRDIASIDEEIDICCIYTDADYFDRVKDELIALHPHMVLVSPGSESSETERELVMNRIAVNRGKAIDFVEMGIL